MVKQSNVISHGSAFRSTKNVEAPKQKFITTNRPPMKVPGKAPKKSPMKSPAHQQTPAQVNKLRKSLPKGASPYGENAL